MRVWESIVAINVVGSFGAPNDLVKVNLKEEDLGIGIEALYQNGIMGEVSGEGTRSHKRYLEEIFEEYLKGIYDFENLYNVDKEIEDDEDLENFFTDKELLFGMIDLLVLEVATMDIKMVENVMNFEFETYEE